MLVTGATGHVGREAVAAARRLGVPVTAAVRDPARSASPDDVRAVAFDFRDRATWPAALDGHTRLFLMRPPAIADARATLDPLVDAARTRGIAHIAFLSVAGAERNRFLPHRRTEDHLRRDGRSDFTVLRPGFFAQNLESAYRDDIVADDRIYVPAGRAPVNWIDAADIGEVAARVLVDPAAHRGAAYTLCGPGPVEWDAVAATLGEVLHRRIRYVPASVPGYVRHLHRRGLARDAIAVQTVLHVLLRFGQGARTDPTLARLLGRPGRSVHDYIRANVPRWARR
ncbi:SDR family NAD(P)-dependent oxidoreductase [Tolypothrix campylonemoides VB511288]|nr:SDR family NAD(P)-dependent oxidoreductase [Tolypothrix campylonemoides VB511288]